MRSATHVRRTTKPPKPEIFDDLYTAILQLKSKDECRRFFYDLCTPKEISDMAERWWVARLLAEGQLSYRDIHEVTGVSVTTIGRVARFLEQESFEGYKLMLTRMGKS
ncbi:MAG: hypothetical protein EOM37_00045 [Proteobacteria bacterium]|jgi:TrpR-related protein YerC/YecD|nr:YerC/YecD family TrpR-related protein [Alphaproteobacteria bacterium]NCC02429.1 hypothetical protein [Pseudomonadota bacterium]